MCTGSYSFIFIQISLLWTGKCTLLSLATALEALTQMTSHGFHSILLSVTKTNITHTPRHHASLWIHETRERTLGTPEHPLFKNLAYNAPRGALNAP